MLNETFINREILVTIFYLNLEVCNLRLFISMKEPLKYNLIRLNNKVILNLPESYNKTELNNYFCSLTTIKKILKWRLVFLQSWMILQL